MNKLDNLIKDKISHLQNITSDKEKVEEEKKKNEDNQKWLKDFMSRLDNILEI